MDTVFLFMPGVMFVNLSVFIPSGQCMSDLSAELQKAKDEVFRLVANWRTLLDAMPEMVFLFRNDGIVEYQNSSARNCFGDITVKGEAGGLHKLEGLDVDGLSDRCGTLADVGAVLTESLFNGIPVEYSVAPFAGYSGDHLFMVVMRDISRRKQYEEELRNFNTNIEVILRKKIIALKESEETRKRLASQLNSLKNHLGVYHEADRMVGSSRVMRALRDMIHQVAKSDATVLITGESGTGKELVANLVKAISDRNDKPFLKINSLTILFLRAIFLAMKKELLPGL